MKISFEVPVEHATGHVQLWDSTELRASYLTSISQTTEEAGLPSLIFAHLWINIEALERTKPKYRRSPCPHHHVEVIYRPGTLALD